MSEKEKMEQEQENTAPVEEVKEEETAPETFTVTKEQMEKMEALAKLVSDGNDKYLRLAAEYDNYRKRTTKEKEAIYGTAKADTIKPFLDVYDNLLRGAAQCEEGDSHRQGLEMIAKQFLSVLEKLGVTEIEAEGQPFDPEKHNAVMHIEDDAIGENTVAEVFQKGFMLGDKVLRFAMVKVAN
ncbi:MAG: nucleotide exchange factor GrpE [Clostridiales bacterium]|nr:nucleotide exchange factor GrpE [Candidatus Cacconaster stercorequi]